MNEEIYQSEPILKKDASLLKIIGEKNNMSMTEVIHELLNEYLEWLQQNQKPTVVAPTKQARKQLTVEEVNFFLKKRMQDKQPYKEDVPPRLP
jgi:glutamyl-tRNA reductase